MTGCSLDKGYYVKHRHRNISASAYANNSNTESDQIPEINPNVNQWASHQLPTYPTYNMMFDHMYRQYYDQYINNL